jgi:hypothetical protein
LQNTHKDLEV